MHICSVYKRARTVLFKGKECNVLPMDNTALVKPQSRVAVVKRKRLLSSLVTPGLALIVGAVVLQIAGAFPHIAS